MNALEFELQRVRDRYQIAFEYLKEYSNIKELPKLKEVIGKLLTSPFLVDAIGGYCEPRGYMGEMVEDTPLKRMEFIGHFVGYDLLDDGDPGLAWHKYDLRGHKSMYRLCKKEERNACPFFFRRKEILKPEPPLLSMEQVVWTLDWYEEKDRGRCETMSEWEVDTTPVEPNPIMVEIAKELGYDGNGK